MGSTTPPPPRTWPVPCSPMVSGSTGSTKPYSFVPSLSLSRLVVAGDRDVIHAYVRGAGRSVEGAGPGAPCRPGGSCPVLCDRRALPLSSCCAAAGAGPRWCDRPGAPPRCARRSPRRVPRPRSHGSAGLGDRLAPWSGVAASAFTLLALLAAAFSSCATADDSSASSPTPPGHLRSTCGGISASTASHCRLRC